MRGVGCLLLPHDNALILMPPLAFSGCCTLYYIYALVHVVYQSLVSQGKVVIYMQVDYATLMVKT